jgi:hypothetical protein
VTEPDSSSQIVGVRFTKATLIVSLSDGREISTPLSWYPRLSKASEKERSQWEISPLGLHWPQLDEDIGLAGMLAGETSAARIPTNSATLKTPESIHDRRGQKWSFAYGNVVADNDTIPAKILDQLHNEIEIAINDS